MANNKHSVSVWVILGTNAVDNFDNNRKVPTQSRGEGVAVLKQFKNEGEKSSYLQGLSDGNGWQDFTTAGIEEVEHVVGGIKLKKVK